MFIHTDVVVLGFLATFVANVPIVFVTFRSRRFDNDSVAKIIVSLAVSDIINGVIAGCCAGVAWSLQPGQTVPLWLLRLILSRPLTFLRRRGMTSNPTRREEQRTCHLAVLDSRCSN